MKDQMKQATKLLKEFDKPPLSVSEQVDLLKSRGIIVPNSSLAEHFLFHCNYYRFSGYSLHFEIFKDRKRTHKFKPNTTFDDVKNLYEFDDRLRAILFDYIGHVEISVRSTMCNFLAVQTKNPHWYLDSSLFCQKFHKKQRNNVSNYEAFLKTVDLEFARSREVFIQSYKDNYSEPVLPPSWMMVEVLTMGNWSKLYENLANLEFKKEIGTLFDLHNKVFTSWIRALSVLRNHCAHHSRIWNKSFHISPIIQTATKEELLNIGFYSEKQTHLLPFFIAINKLLGTLHRKNQFQQEMKCLFKNFTNISLEKMGLNEDILKWLGYR